MKAMVTAQGKAEQKKSPRRALLRTALAGLSVVVIALCAVWARQGRFGDIALAPGAESGGAEYNNGAQSARDKRETAYQADIAALREIVESESAGEETRADAGRRLTAMISRHQTEMALETALITAGFEDSLALMQEGALTVIIAGTELDDKSSATILAVCLAHSGADVENIRIMTKAP